MSADARANSAAASRLRPAKLYALARCIDTFSRKLLDAKADSCRRRSADCACAISSLAAPPPALTSLPCRRQEMRSSVNRESSGSSSSPSRISAVSPSMLSGAAQGLRQGT